MDYLTDVDSLWTYMKHADKQIKLKRRWLMGLPTSKDEDQQIQWPAFLQNRYLPESLLREDDVFYETSKTSVKKAFGTPNLEKENHSFQESVRDVDIPCLSKELSSRLDDISNTGLHLLAMHLTKNQNLADFYQFSLDIVALQNNITKAIWLINEKCDDMDVIPRSLLDALSMINRSSRNVPQRYFLKDDIDEDVECMLDISAQAKQIILDFLPDHNYDLEFTDAYMEDLQESSASDESDTDDALLFGSERSPDNIFRINDSAEPAESIGDSSSLRKMFQILIHPSQNTAVDANVDEEVDPTEQSDSDNKYLCIQEACDETSLFAYKCIGRLLEECARIQGSNLDPVDSSYLRGGHSVTEDAATQKQGDDVGGMFICQVVEELLPSISNSVKEKLEKMMSLL
ncbi:unnamed protein product [Rhodiola kirilowii]